MRTKILVILLLLDFAFIGIQAQAPNWAWAKGAGQLKNDYGFAIASDQSGNVYCTGFFSDSIIFGSTTLIAQQLGDEVFIVKYNEAGNVIWAKSGIGNGNGNNWGNSITTDNYGNVYLTGYFWSPSISFDNVTINNNGYGDMFVVKYDSTGNVIWAKSGGGLDQDYGYGIAVDNIGNVFVIGDYKSTTVYFDSISLPNAGGWDIFVLKYDANGMLLWARGIGGISDDHGSSIATESGDSIYIAGNFHSLVFGIDSIILHNTHPGSDNYFISKIKPNGRVLWAKNGGGTNNAHANSIVTDTAGNVYLVGQFAGDGFYCGSTLLNSRGSWDILLIKFYYNGYIIWAKNIGSTGGEIGNSIVLDDANNIYITGIYNKAFTYDSISSLTLSGGYDIFVGKHDENGNTIWAKGAGSQSGDIGYGITSTPGPNIYITGWFNSDTLTIGNSILANADTTSTWANVYIAKLSAVTGINSPEKNAFFIYPNPSVNGHIIIESRTAIRTVLISDALGQIIYQSDVDDKFFSLQLERAGIFLVSVTTENQRLSKKIIVVN